MMIFAVGDQAVAELADLRDALIQLARTRLSSRQVQVMIIVLCGDDDDDNADDDDDNGDDDDDDNIGDKLFFLRRLFSLLLTL